MRRGGLILTAPGEVHRSGYGVVSVYRQGDEHVGRAVGDENLGELHDLASDVTRVPSHRVTPY